MRSAVLALVFLAACRSSSTSPSTSPSPSPSPSPSTSTSAPTSPALVSLLSFTDSRVVVSSTVDNPRDFPEHLIDNDPGTAWNGKTGDLVGGFILFRVPKEARVDRVRITCGFDRVAKDGTDLFTANHRVKKLRVTRDGVLVREVTLDTERRDLQSIPVDAPGGDYKLEVMETLAGTKPEWKELVVSELLVLGEPGAARLPHAHAPRVRVGSLDASIWKLPAAVSGTGPRASIDAYCKWFAATNDAAVRAQFKAPDFPCQDPNARAACNEAHAAPLMPPGPLKELVWLDAEGATTGLHDLAIVQQDGSFTVIGGTRRERCQLGDADMPDITLISARHEQADGGVAIARVVLEYVTRSPMYSDPDTREPRIWIRADAHREEIVCRAAANGAPACEAPKRLKSFITDAAAGGALPPYEAW